MGDSDCCEDEEFNFWMNQNNICSLSITDEEKIMLFLYYNDMYEDKPTYH